MSDALYVDLKMRSDGQYLSQSPMASYASWSVAKNSYSDTQLLFFGVINDESALFNTDDNCLAS